MGIPFDRASGRTELIRGSEVDGLSRADLLKVGAAYSTNWSDAMRTTVLNNAFTQTHLSKPTPGNFNAYGDALSAANDRYWKQAA
jgi:hypothetical protein